MGMSGLDADGPHGSADAPVAGEDLAEKARGGSSGYPPLISGQLKIRLPRVLEGTGGFYYLAMTADKVMRMKPQNLLVGLQAPNSDSGYGGRFRAAALSIHSWTGVCRAAHRAAASRLADFHFGDRSPCSAA